jgi:glc operon protein GlcG
MLALCQGLLADDARPLVQRGAIRLQAAGAQVAIDAAIAKAEAMQLKVNIAVVDEGGELYRFARMDGARPASVFTAITKANTSALIRAETGPLMADGAVNTHLNLAVENAAHASGGKFTSLKGGVPLVVDGQIVGAIGVGGATGEQDQEIARAAAEALRVAATSK